MTVDSLWVPKGSFRPRRYRPGGIGNWSGHLAFANDLIAEMRPGLLVELGTHYGESYFGFCQAVSENNVACSCYAVDTWVGERHASVYDESVYEEVSSYNSTHYGNFSYLLRTTFDDALAQFSDDSIDILHIDGLHTYEAVSHDFRTWFNKVKPGGIVLMHDTMTRHADFGVWKLWEELKGSHHHFKFTHSWGLGVVRKAGSKCPDNPLFRALFEGSAEYRDHIRKFYAISALALSCEYDSANRDAGTIRTNKVLVQVFPFFDGYSAASAVGHELAADKWERFTVELSNGTGNGPLRLDPADRPAIIDISALALRRPLEGAILWAANGCAELSSLEIGGTLARLRANDNQEFVRFVSFGDDPQLFLPAAARFDQPLVVELWLRVQTDDGAVVRLLQQSDQRDAIAEERDRLLAEQEKWKGEREAIMVNHRKMHSELYVTRTDLATARADLETAQTELKKLGECQARCRELEQAIEGVVKSYSWRITKPVREVMMLLRRGPRS